MKKSLINVAVLGSMLVAGSAFAADASFSLTGSVGFGLSQGSAKDSKARFGITDGGATITAVQDLENGIKATAQANLALDTGPRGSAVGINDRSIILSGGFGAVKLWDYDSANNAMAADISGASLPTGLDNTNFGLQSANVAGVAYISPELVPGLKVGVAVTHGSPSTKEVTAAKAAVVADATVTPAVPAAPAVVAVNNTNDISAAAPSVSVSYSANGFSARLAFKNLGSNSGNAKPIDSASALQGQASTNFDVSYDAKVVKVAFGYSQATTKDADGLDNIKSKNPAYVLGVSAPVGPVTLGLAYATRKGTDDKDNSGMVMGVNYDLGKNTAVNVSFANAFTVAGATSSGQSQYRVKLVQSF